MLGRQDRRVGFERKRRAVCMRVGGTGEVLGWASKVLTGRFMVHVSGESVLFRFQKSR